MWCMQRENRELGIHIIKDFLQHGKTEQGIHIIKDVLWHSILEVIKHKEEAQL